MLSVFNTHTQLIVITEFACGLGSWCMHTLGNCISISSASDVSWYNCIFHLQDLDIVTKQLLAKAGESNNFIRDDVEQSLSSMVEGVTPQRSLLALIAGGATWVHVFWCYCFYLCLAVLVWWSPGLGRWLGSATWVFFNVFVLIVLFLCLAVLAWLSSGLGRWLGDDDIWVSFVCFCFLFF